MIRHKYRLFSDLSLFGLIQVLCLVPHCWLRGWCSEVTGAVGEVTGAVDEGTGAAGVGTTVVGEGTEDVRLFNSCYQMKRSNHSNLK